MPVGNVLVGDTRCHVKHDDTTLAVDVVSITETTELLLAGSIPDVKLNGAKVLNQTVSIPPSGWLCPGPSRTVVNPSGWTSTPNVAMYFFSNSPVKWRLTKVVCIGHRRVNNGPSRDDNPDGDALQQKGDRTTPIEWIDQAGRGLGTEDETTGGGVRNGRLETDEKIRSRCEASRCSQQANDPTYLSSTAVTDEDQLEGRWGWLSHVDQVT